MKHLVSELEKTFSKTIAECYPYEWDENHISHTLMKAMRDMFSKRRVRYKGFTKIIEWFSYKNKGKVETAFGDISLFFNIQFSSGEILKGVAFLEAKRDSVSGYFESLAVPQLERIIQHAPYSQLLMYRNKLEKLPLKFPDDAEWKSHIWAAPINTIIPKLKQLRPSQNSNVLRVSMPFASLLTSRFFWGLDLDYREEAFNRAVSGVGNLPMPDFLGVINVYYENQFPVQTSLSDNWEPL